MRILHISTECYPAAKAGGMGDVVGALPNYLPMMGVNASVIIPKYSNKWISSQKWHSVRSFFLTLDNEEYICDIEKLENDILKFPLYVINIPGLFDRASIYLNDDGEGYSDEAERYIAFQRAVLDWLLLENKFDQLHCHDHMTGLVSFMIKHCPRYNAIKHLPVSFTIHNGQYRGVMDWSVRKLLPTFEDEDAGLLDWDGFINGLATAIKCAHFITTVSPSYLDELKSSPDSISSLLIQESDKTKGVLNGIDEKLWDPQTDPMIEFNLKSDVGKYKFQNKEALASKYGFKSSKILLGFIGRFATQKGADLLSDAYDAYLQTNDSIHFFILGSGDKSLESDVLALREKHPNNVTAVVAYDEALAHQVYAASDYLIMPSRFEPCGLNQFYAMRYGTIPVVRSTGGLKDTVPDIGDGGYGITFLRDTSEDVLYSLGRIEELHSDSKALQKLLLQITQLDFSWTKSAESYSKIYQTISNDKH